VAVLTEEPFEQTAKIDELPEEPPTEPIAPVGEGPSAPAPLPLGEGPRSGGEGAFTKTRYHFMTGLPAGEAARVRDDEGNIVLTYRSFASVIGIVAALVAAIVVVAGAAGTLFLVAEGRPIAAIGAVVLCVFFTGLIAMLVPATSVTLYEGSAPALTISQRSRFSFPAATHAIATPDGRTLALVRKSVFSRLGRNRWRIVSASDGRTTGYALEESLGRALVRKVMGKFNRNLETNLALQYLGHPAGWIVRRPEGDGRADILDLSAATPAIDRRVAVGVATLVLGSEP